MSLELDALRFLLRGCAHHPLRSAAAALSFAGREGVLLIPAILPLGVLAGWGHALGLPNLFWRTSPEEPARRVKTRIAAGLALGILLGTDVLVLLLVESAGGDAVAGFAFGLQFQRIAALLVGIVALIYAKRVLREPLDWMGSLSVPVAALAGLGAMDALVRRLPGYVPPWVARRILPLVHPLPHETLVPFHVAAGALLVLGGLTYLALLLVNRLRGWRIYPAAGVCVLLCVVAAAHGFVAYRLPAAQVPLYLGLALVYAALNARWGRAVVPSLEPTAIPAPPHPPLIADQGALSSWRQRHGSARKPVLLLVTASGGGIRSALWTATVLTGLEDAFPAFPQHARLLTGASGGMLGAAAWTATLPDPSAAESDEGRRRRATALLDALEQGGISAIVSGVLFRDLLPAPLRFGPDRGRSLEVAWERYCAAMAGPVAALAAGEQEGWRPSLVLTPMVVEDGRRLVISNLDLDALCQSAGPLGTGATTYSLSAVQLEAALPGARRSLALSTAVRLQANFPWALPSTEIPPLQPGAPRLRVVDAGYYDDTGVDLACLWLRQHRAWLLEETAGVLLVQCRDTTSIDRCALPQRRRSALERGFDGLVSPVSAALRARDSTTWFRNDATVAALARSFNVQAPFFSTLVFELPFEASLSWSLTRAEASMIRGAMAEKGNPGARDSFRAWVAAHA